MKKLKRRLIALKFKIDFILFFLFKNYDWDYGYLLELIEKKLTAMGVTIYTNDFIVDKKKVVRSLWQARFYLKRVLHKDYFSETASNIDNKVKEKFGYYITPISNRVPIDNGMVELKTTYLAMREHDFGVIFSESPILVPDFDEALKYYRSLFLNCDREENKNKDFDQFLSILSKNVWSWWD